jgi:bifunctional non-homologous end joining protein LigD
MPSSLREYERKRNFRHTPEPRGGTRARRGGLRYVIQKHHARRLHYDFRLELDGALKSWAVPNGPSADPGVKRLAVHVEDHPLEYAKFEGEIPPGHYGAGKVEIWDDGLWRPQGDARQGYRKGHLAFELEGKRLHGGWDLVRMRSKPDEKGKDNWLLIKRADKSRPREKKQKAAPMPRMLSPQLATLVDAAPAGDDWLYEIKYDGYRMLCRIEGGKARIFSRNGKDWTARFPRHAEAMAKLPVRQAWLDGEMAVFLPDGSTSFQALQNSLDAGAESDIRYALFDLLHLDGIDWSRRPLIERKERLSELLEKQRSRLFFYSHHLEGNGKKAWDHACEHELEGIIGKQREAPYTQQRSRSWIKLKCRRGQELVIGGYTEPGGSRSGFGSLLMGVRGEGKDRASAMGSLRYVGKVGTGFDARTLAALRKRLESLEQKKSPFAGKVAEKGAHWVKPALVADIEFAGWTDSGLVRQGAFMGLREDKPAAEVKREEPRKQPKENEEDNVVAGVKITHPERVLYPALKATKLDLARYYESVADWILPHLRDRPLSLVRCPRGPAHKCFFQRNAHDTMPKRGAFIVADTLEAVAQLVQMGVIELHTWGSRAAKPKQPDRMIFDLDPDPDLPWAKVVEGATLVRTLLSELPLVSYVKTTGGKGLHVVAPLKPGHSWKDVKDFALRVAQHMAATLPHHFTASVSKAQRKGKIFIDYLRNQEWATAVAAYSVRAREQATVSLPVTWDELTSGLKPEEFDLRSVVARLERLEDDPWEGYAETQRLTETMQKML